MRLIDADALKLKKVYCQERHELVVPVAEIDWMPTAYDVEKVCEELEALNPVDYGSIYSYEGHSCAREMKRDAIDIVERGGVDED